MSTPAFTSLAAAALVCLSTVAPASDPLPRARPEEVGMSSARLARLGDRMRRYVDEGRLAGHVLLVARRGRIAYLQAYGLRDRESRAPMREDTLFRIASQTKALTSVGAMMLVEEGRLGLEDEVGRYLPDFDATTVAVPREGGGIDTVKAKRPITIHDLLTHTSGISYGDGPAATSWAAAGIDRLFASNDVSRGEAVARLAKLPFDAQPGEKWWYGYSTDVLGVVIERVSGKSLDAFLRERILEPLRMTDTRFYLSPSEAGRLATVYSLPREASALQRAPDKDAEVTQGGLTEGPKRRFSGGGGLLSTAGDFARFMQMMLNGGELEGIRILGRKSVELMTVDHLGGLEYEPGVGFGLGFYVVKDVGARGIPGSVGEYGWGGAYHTIYWMDPREQLAVVYLTQLLPGELDDHARLRALVYQAIAD